MLLNDSSLICPTRYYHTKRSHMMLTVTLQPVCSIMDCHDGLAVSRMSGDGQAKIIHGTSSTIAVQQRE